MKKFFTLVAVAAMALTANAQGTIMCTGETGDAVVAVPAIDYSNCQNLTVTVNASGDGSGVKIKANDKNEAILYGTTQFEKRWEIQGGNALDDGGKKYSISGNVPTTGAFIKLEPKVAGKI